MSEAIPSNLSISQQPAEEVKASSNEDVKQTAPSATRPQGNNYDQRNRQFPRKHHHNNQNQYHYQQRGGYVQKRQMYAQEGPAQEFYAVPAYNMYPANYSTYFALDVECVATGAQHNARAVGQIAIVDQFERVLLNLFIKPKEKVFSYMTGLTGLTEEVLSKGIEMEQALAIIRQVLPKHAILVGHTVLQDVQWLGLEEGKDFAGLQDLSGLWRVFNPKYNSFTYFSLHHESKCLLGIEQQAPHNAVTDAIISIKLFMLYKMVEKDPEKLQASHKLLLSTPTDASFAKLNPVYDGVCMGQRKACTCGAPFFY